MIDSVIPTVYQYQPLGDQIVSIQILVDGLTSMAPGVSEALLRVGGESGSRNCDLYLQTSAIVLDPLF